MIARLSAHFQRAVSAGRRSSGRWEWAAFGLLVLVAVAVVGGGNGYQVQMLFTIGMFVVLAYSWNLISGLTGYISFGQTSFFGLGAYGAALSTTHFFLPWYGGVAVAVVVASTLAVLLGGVMLRLRGIFFALGMFGLARIGEIAATSAPFTGGSSGQPMPVVGIPRVTAAAMLVAACGVIALTAVILRSRLGVRLMAIRDDETAAAAAGVDTRRTKIGAFTLSAAIAGVAGALYAWNIGYIDPNSTFDPTLDLQIILMVLIGGIGTLWGPLIGAVAIALLSEFLGTRFPLEEQMILGLLTVLCVVFLPGGLVSLLNRFGWLGRRAIWSPPPEPPQTARTLLPAPTNPAPTTASENGQEVLGCELVTKRFGGLTALSDVDVRLHRGEFLAVIGPNGAGKTTLFNIVSGFDLPTSGRIRFLGRDTTRQRPHRHARSGIARTFQTRRLFPSLTVWETVLLSALDKPRAEARVEAARVLEALGLADLWDHPPEQLPPGQQRLVEIGRALMLRPQVLLLDEAMAAMTPAEVEQVQRVLSELVAGGCAVMAIEHALSAIAPLADRVQVLDYGETIADGRPREVLRDPRVIEAYLGGDHEAVQPEGSDHG